MTETIVSDAVKEKEGLNTENIEDVVNQINEDADIDSDEVATEVETPPIENTVLTQEYYDQTLAQMETMNFIEIQKLQRELKQQLDELPQIKETAEGLVNMEQELRKTAESLEDDEADDYAAKIEQADLEAEHGLNDMHQFLDTYDDTFDKLSQLLAKAEEYVKKYDDIPKTTSYLTKCMLEVIEKNKSNLPADHPNIKRLNIYYKEVMNIFQNRQSVDWIISKIPDKKIYIRRFKQSAKKDKSGRYIKNVQKAVTSTFCKVFNVNQLQEFEKYLTSVFDNSDISFYFQYILYLIYAQEKDNGKYGKHKWVEVMIMNILDIIIDNYDLEGGKESYNEELLKIKQEVEKII